MITSNGYCLTYYKNKNQIVICLPQTLETATNTYGQVVDRRTDVEEKDLAILMNVTQAIFHKEMNLPEPIVYPQVEGITPTVAKMDEATE